MRLAFVFALLVSAGEPANPLLRQLLDKGLLPAPLMSEGMTAKEQQAVLEKAAGNRPLDLFTKKSLAAPFALKINSARDATGKRAGRLTLDLAFIAFGDLDRVIKEDVLNQLIGTEAKKGKDVTDVLVLTADQLRSAASRN